MKYAALMFDIVESRHYNHRYDIQNTLMNAVDYLNHLYSKDIKKDIVSSAGDEFQGLFYNLQSAFLYIRKLQLLIYPIKIRCGVGYGEIKYDVEFWTSSSFDGDAYYLARDAINQASKKKNSAIFFNTRSVFDKYLNMLCLSSTEIKTHQSQVARWVELLADIVLPIKYVNEDISFYKFILEMRHKIIVSEQWNRVYGKARRIEPFKTNFRFLFEIKEEFSYKDDYYNKFFVEEFWGHGMSTVLSQAMGTSRQNIDRYISLGRIKDSRTIDKTIYDFLGEQIW